MTRVAAGATRSVSPAWASMRWSASSVVDPRPTSRARWIGRIAFDQPDLVAQGRQPAFDQPDRLDHDRIRTVGRCTIHGREDPRPNCWMDDRLEIAQRRRIGEHHATERRAVE